MREYAHRDVREEVCRSSSAAGGWAGRARNRQPGGLSWLEDPGAPRASGRGGEIPPTVKGARVGIRILGKKTLNTGRAAQNMMLVAWNDGVVSCPNGMPEPEQARAALRLGADDEIAIVLRFGYPARPRDPLRHTPTSGAPAPTASRSELSSRRVLR